MEWTRQKKISTPGMNEMFSIAMATVAWVICVAKLFLCTT